MTYPGREIVAGLVIISILVAYLLVFYAAALIIVILGARLSRRSRYL